MVILGYQNKSGGVWVMGISEKAEIPFITSVLHPTDFSPGSDQAFAHALAIAVLRQTEFTILHIGPEKEADVEWSRYPAVRKTLERWGMLEAGSRQADVFDKLRVQVVKKAVRSRHPAFAAADLADLETADLIVLATSGAKGGGHWVNRSMAESMARWSGTMTLFVPSSAKRGIISLDTGELRLKNILVPIDRVPDCTAALEIAKRVADLFGDGDVVITALHVGDVEPPGVVLDDGPGWSWRKEQHKGGDPKVEILAVADRLVADLIIMTTAGHDSVMDALRGSTTEQVLRNAPRPS